MPSEISQRNRDYSQDLNDLQSQYAKRRREMLEGEQQDLSQIKGSYEREKAELTKAGEAAVNHIKKDNLTRTEALQTQTHQQYLQQKEANEKSIAGLRKYAESVEKNTDQQIRERQQSSTERMQHMQDQEELEAKRLYESSRKVYEQHQANLQNAHEKSKEELNKLLAKEALEKNKAIARSEGELKHINEQYHERLEDTRSHQQMELDEVKQEGTNAVESRRKQTASNLEKEHATENRRLQEMKKSYQTQANQFTRTGEERLQNIQTTYGERLHHEIAAEKAEAEAAAAATNP